jgi:hypothetical protein
VASNILTLTGYKERWTYILELVAMLIILFINVYFVYIVCRLLKYFGKGQYEQESKKYKCCCKRITRQKKDEYMKSWIIVLIILHLTDCVLTLSSPTGNLIYLSLSDKDLALAYLYAWLIISRFIRNTIELIMLLSFLFLVKRVSDAIFKHEKVAQVDPAPDPTRPSQEQRHLSQSMEEYRNSPKIKQNIYSPVKPGRGFILEKEENG